MLLSGEVQVAIHGKVIRNLSKSGIAIGEKALITDRHKVGATVTAVNGPVTAMRLMNQDFLSVQAGDPDDDGGDDIGLIPSGDTEADANGALPQAFSSITVGPPTPGADGPRGDPISDFHWHESKWDERAARTTLNAQGGYDGSEDHPGYGTEPGPDFR